MTCSNPIRSTFIGSWPGVTPEPGHALIAGPWSHSGLPLGRRTGDRDHGPEAVRDLHNLQRTWFDRYLRGVGDGSPKVEVFVTGQQSWEQFAQWPPNGSTHRWYPAPEGSLNPAPPGASTESIAVSVSDPTPAIGGRVYPWEPRLRPGAFDQRQLLARDDVLWFSSEILEEDMVVVGEVRLSAVADGDSAVIDLYAVVCEVDPDGVAWNLTDGIGRSSPGRLEVRLGSIAHRFRAGARLALLVAFSADPRFDLTLDHAGRRELILGPDTRLEIPTLS